MQNPIKTNSSIPSKKEFANKLRFLSRISYWVHLFFGTISGITILLVIFSRSTNTQASNSFIELSIFLAISAIITVGLRIYWDWRYTRLARRLRQPNSNLHPKREEVIEILRVGLIVSLVGLALAFIASEIATVAVLAKAIAQPQGVAIYNPERLVRDMDLFLILANVNLVGAHLLGSVDSIGLLNWISKE